MTTNSCMVDTNIVSNFMRFPRGPVAERMKSMELRSVGVSIIVVSELRFGVANVGSKRLHDQVEAALSELTVMPLEEPVDWVYAELRANLSQRGRPIGPNDLFIAAHALALGVPLATANVGEFSRVPNLIIEHWLD